VNPAVFLSVAILAQAAAGYVPAIVPPPATMQTGATWEKNFTLHFENDSLPGAGGDDSYTQGLELRVRRGEQWRLLEPVLKRLWTKEGADQFERAATGVLGQTMLTPLNVITYSPSPADRPFAGFLYAGIEASRIREEPVVLRAGTPRQKTLRRERLSVSAVVGIIGPWAGARDTQSGVHILRENRMAKGWLTSQLGTQPQLNLRGSREVIPFRIRDNVDLTVLNEIVLGTTQTYAGAGATLRIGRALSSFPSGVIAYSAMGTPAKHFEFGLVGSARARFMAHNAFVGGLIASPTGLKTERGVIDLNAGVEARWKAWRLSYLVARRSKEFSPLPAGVPDRHRFVALNLSRENWGEDATERLQWLKDGMRLNFRLGRGGSRVSPSYIEDHTPSLAASMGLEHSLFRGRFSVGYETTATTREGGPPAAGQTTHSDLFLFAKAFTAGWEPTRTTSRHKLQIRAGGGWAVAKHQVIPDTGSIIEPKPLNSAARGRSLLVGARYALRLGNPISLTADISGARLSINKALVRRADILTMTVGVQIHPWNRDAR
jgi:lipid A 3-O-deacylase